MSESGGQGRLPEEGIFELPSLKEGKSIQAEGTVCAEALRGDGGGHPPHTGSYVCREAVRTRQEWHRRGWESQRSHSKGP